VVTDGRQHIAYAFGGVPGLALTNGLSRGQIRTMTPSPQRLDPDRRRRRLELLAALADLKSARENNVPLRSRDARLRGLIAKRRRFAG
jgi:hypothetical protein